MLVVVPRFAASNNQTTSLDPFLEAEEKQRASSAKWFRRIFCEAFASLGKARLRGKCLEVAPPLISTCFTTHLPEVRDLGLTPCVARQTLLRGGGDSRSAL